MSVRLQRAPVNIYGAVPSRLAAWAAVGAAALCSFSINVNAAEAVPQRTVRYADLNPSNMADAKALYSRLERAAKVVCRSLESREVERIKLHQDCYETALSNAVLTVDYSTVTALYRSDSSIRVAQRGTDLRQRG